uniref:Uncharacterized protein n=1 Tax=Glossina palpalis gambiensis TaxID=67801 RepID=A0A1B0AQV0_9MUSC
MSFFLCAVLHLKILTRLLSELVKLVGASVDVRRCRFKGVEFDSFDSQSIIAIDERIVPAIETDGPLNFRRNLHHLHHHHHHQHHQHHHYHYRCHHYHDYCYHCQQQGPSNAPTNQLILSNVFSCFVTGVFVVALIRFISGTYEYNT